MLKVDINNNVLYQKYTEKENKYRDDTKTDERFEI